MRTARLLAVSLVVISWLGRPAAGGIVNVQSILATEAEEGFSGAVTAAADWRTGNVDLLTLSAAPVARVRAGKNLVVGILRGEYGRASAGRYLASTFAHLRYRRDLRPRLQLEGFAQHELDRIRRLASRALVGAGPRLLLIDRGKLEVALGVAYMLELEQLREDMEPDAGQRDLQHRASSYAAIRYEIDDRLQAVQTAYAQPRLTNATDVRLLSESQLVVKIAPTLAFTTSFVIAYDAAPPEAIEKLDTALKSSITINF
ncbi:MAG TPA: DUF481 domain-containing protein [Kofleriaceae bacterium]|nr:DUF481 domain-containing protein [Kofleriaceae bacterium]